MEWLTALKDYVPLFQTITWAVLILIVLSSFHKPLQNMLVSLQKRVGGGSIEVITGFFTLKLGELRNLEYIESDTTEATLHIAESINNDKVNLPKKWLNNRNDIYQNNRGIFLVHVLEPSKISNQEFDIFIFLLQHNSIQRPADRSVEIDYSEFFFGPAWKNRLFTIQNTGGPIGLHTSAHGPFLATCRVVFKDGYEIILDRYVDFEMGKKVIIPATKWQYTDLCVN